MRCENCEDALPLLYDLADGDIDRDGAVSLAEHLAECAECPALLLEIRGREAVYRERLDAAATLPARTADELADAVWREGAPRLPLSADRGPLAFSLGAAAAAALAAAGTSGAWMEGAIGWVQAAGSAATSAFLAALAPQPGESLGRVWDALTSRALSGAAISGLALAALGGIALLQVLGSAWLLSAGGGARPRRERS